MSCFRAATSNGVNLDPALRVRYSRGMVLGVDDFQQEQLHLIEKDRLHNRLLHGYGTACGLEVTHEAGKVTVHPGIAVDSMGREVRVEHDQCGDLADWVTRHHEDRDSEDRLVAYVVLRYVECPTAEVPVPGEPCRTAEDSRVASRTQESFRIDFQATAPAQAEEDAVRAFGDLVDAIQITATPPHSTFAQLADAVEKLPAAPPAGLRLAPENAADTFRRLFRRWIVKTRPGLADGAEGCCRGPQDATELEDRPGVLLMRFVCKLKKVGTAWSFDKVTKADPGERPCLLHTRVLQEFVQRRFGVMSHHQLEDLADGDDHPQYLLVDPGDRSLVEDLDGGGHRIVHLAPGAADGDALVHGQDAAGDLGGHYPAPLVNGLAGKPLDAASPANGQVLRFSGGRWQPATIPTGGGEDLVDHAIRLRTLPFATIWPMDVTGREMVFRVWFHLGFSGRGEEAILNDGWGGTALQVFSVANAPTGVPDAMLNPIAIRNVVQAESNLFDVMVAARTGMRLRFVFQIANMDVTTDTGRMTLVEWAFGHLRDRPLKWLGHDAADQTVTVPVRVEGPRSEPVDSAGTRLVMAGTFDVRGRPRSIGMDANGKVFGNTVRARALGRNSILVTFAGYKKSASYVVSATPIGEDPARGGYALKATDDGLQIASEDPRWLGVSLRVEEIS